MSVSAKPSVGSETQSPVLAAIGPAFLCNARFPLRPSALAFALNSRGSILNTTGRALRDLAGR